MDKICPRKQTNHREVVVHAEQQAIFVVVLSAHVGRSSLGHVMFSETTERSETRDADQMHVIVT